MFSLFVARDVTSSFGLMSLLCATFALVLSSWVGQMACFVSLSGLWQMSFWVAPLGLPVVDPVTVGVYVLLVYGDWLCNDTSLVRSLVCSYGVSFSLWSSL